MLKNFLRDSHWHCGVTGWTHTCSAGVGIAPSSPQWWFGPGNGGSAILSLNEAVHSEWSGNPERFLRCQWTQGAAYPDPIFSPDYWYTFLENKVNSARILAGKEVTFSIEVRGGGGVPIMPVIWRSFHDQPQETLWRGTPVSPGNSPTRIDFTMTLPGIPQGQSVHPEISYIGVGLAMEINYGPTLDIGCSQFNEGEPIPFAEVHRSYERLLCTVP